MREEQLQGSLEENVLTLLCWDDREAPALLLRLTPGIFSSRTYKRIAEAAIAHLERFSIPPKQHLPDLLEDALRKGDEGKFLGDTIDAMADLYKGCQPAFIMAQLDTFISTRKLTQALERASEKLQQGDLGEAREVLYAEGLQDAPTQPGIWLSDPVRMLAFLDKMDADFMSCGIETFDDRGISLARKTLTVFIAPPKKGKTWWLIEVGKRALLHGKRVLHITLENSEELTAARYIQALFALTLKKAEIIRTAYFEKDGDRRMTKLAFDERQRESLYSMPRGELIRKLQDLRAQKKFLIKEFPTGTLTVAQLEAYLDYLERAEGFVPDLLLLDYPDLMKISSENLRIDTGRIFVNIRGIAVKRDIAIAAVTQGNRSSARAKVVTEDMVGEDFSKIATADTVFCYSQTMAEKKLGLARILVSNARTGEDKYFSLITQSYPTGQFCLDSVYMNRFMQEEVERVTGEEKDHGDGEDE